MKPIQIKDCEHYGINEEGVVINTESGKVLKTDLNNCGYKRVTLWAKSQKRIRIAVHRLVAMHYVKNPEEKPVVNHIDGNKLNNHYLNLEWVSCKENTRHAFKKGLRKGPNRLPDKVVRMVRWEQAEGLLSRKDICEKYGISVHQYDDLSRYYKDLV